MSESYMKKGLEAQKPTEVMAEGLRFYLVPDFSAIDGGVIVAAMNQAFFSLSVAGNGSVIYGSYLSKSRCWRDSWIRARTECMRCFAGISRLLGYRM